MENKNQDYSLKNYEVELFKRLEDGDELVKDEIVKSYKGLVISIANRYKSNMDIDELISEGYVGLAIAINKFDYKLGNSFSTYATYWITKGILKYIEENRSLVRIPAYFQELLGKYKKAIENVKEAGLELNDKNIIANLPGNFPLDKYEEVKCHREISVSSLNKKIGDEQDMEYGEMFASSDYDEFEESLIESEQQKAIENCKSCLSEKERLIFNYIQTNTKMNDIGKKVGLSDERIRQLYKSSLAKIKKEVSTKYKGLVMA